jgi:hypothetical protein
MAAGRLVTWPRASGFRGLNGRSGSTTVCRSENSVIRIDVAVAAARRRHCAYPRSGRWPLSAFHLENYALRRAGSSGVPSPFRDERRHMKTDLMRMVALATTSLATQAWLEQPPDPWNIATRHRTLTNRRHTPPRRTGGPRPYPHSERRRGQSSSSSESHEVGVRPEID